MEFPFFWNGKLLFLKRKITGPTTELDVLCRVKSAYWDRRFVPDVFYRFYHRSEKMPVQTWMVCARDHRYIKLKWNNFDKDSCPHWDPKGAV